MEKDMKSILELFGRDLSKERVHGEESSTLIDVPANTVKGFPPDNFTRADHNADFLPAGRYHLGFIWHIVTPDIVPQRPAGQGVSARARWEPTYNNMRELFSDRLTTHQRSFKTVKDILASGAAHARAGDIDPPNPIQITVANELREGRSEGYTEDFTNAFDTVGKICPVYRSKQHFCLIATERDEGVGQCWPTPIHEIKKVNEIFASKCDSGVASLDNLLITENLGAQLGHLYVFEAGIIDNFTPHHNLGCFQSASDQLIGPKTIHPKTGAVVVDRNWVNEGTCITGEMKGLIGHPPPTKP